MLCILPACSFNPPASTGAFDRGVTESKPLPPTPPGQPEIKVARQKKSKAAPKAAAKAAPKFVIPASTNGFVTLSRLRITSDGRTNENRSAPRVQKEFVIDLLVRDKPTIIADEHSAVIIFMVPGTNYVVESIEHFGFTNWTVLSKGQSFDTNAACVVIDAHAGERPHGFYRVRQGP